MSKSEKVRYGKKEGPWIQSMSEHSYRLVLEVGRMKETRNPFNKTTAVVDFERTPPLYKAANRRASRLWAPAAVKRRKKKEIVLQLCLIKVRPFFQTHMKAEKELGGGVGLHVDSFLVLVNIKQATKIRSRPVFLFYFLFFPLFLVSPAVCFSLWNHPN